MTRRTSIEVYRQIEAEGLLSKRRWEVYQLLFKYGPCTSSELFEYYKHHFNPSFHYNMNMHSRLGELREQGAAFEVSQSHVCKIKGNHVILWDVTDRRPKKFVRAKKEENIRITRSQFSKAYKETDKLYGLTAIANDEGPENKLWENMKRASKD